MNEQLFQESRVSFTQLARELDKSVTTIWRWAIRGRKGHVLESYTCGGRRYTTSEAFYRWLAATNGNPVREVTPRQRQRQIDQAERRADELGL